jgi:uncharacterized SAM-binding protein YcdF (DUF218 family)
MRSVVQPSRSHNPIRWRRRLRVGLVAGAAILVVVLAATARLFIWPSTDAIGRADAVVIFVGGRGERLELAERLMGDAVANHLVIPNGHAPEWPDGNAACVEHRRYEVHCPVPDPDNTRGEARAIAALAEAQGWDTLIVVTSTYHLSRSRLLLDRCFEGEILAARARPVLGVPGWTSRIGHEWVAWTTAVAAHRTC